MKPLKVLSSLTTLSVDDWASVVTVAATVGTFAQLTGAESRLNKQRSADLNLSAALRDADKKEREADLKLSATQRDADLTLRATERDADLTLRATERDADKKELAHFSAQLMEFSRKLDSAVSRHQPPPRPG
jgi:hypothetical protein